MVRIYISGRSLSNKEFCRFSSVSIPTGGPHMRIIHDALDSLTGPFGALSPRHETWGHPWFPPWPTAPTSIPSKIWHLVTIEVAYTVTYPEHEDSWKSVDCCAWLHIHNVYWPRVYSISQWWNVYEKERASPPGQFIALQAINALKGTIAG